MTLRGLFLLNIVLSLIFSQEIPSEYFLTDSINNLFDYGMNWTNNSTLDQIRYADVRDDMNDSSISKMKTSFGTKFNKYNYHLIFDNRIVFKEYFFLHARFRATNDEKSIKGYTGIPRKKKRFGGLNSGEYEYASFGFQNEWLLFQLGRGRQSWGAGKGINIILNEFSPSYDYALFGFDLKNYKFRYFHGFLESRGFSDPINRYILGRAIEKTNYKNLIFSFSEIIIYQGVNRPLDISMLSPVGLHTEIELNNRQNSPGNNQNAVWQFSLDYHTLNRIRFSINYLIDELTIDTKEINEGETNLTAFSFKSTYYWGDYNDIKLLTDFSIETVGTYTFKHFYGMNNFVSRGKTLGNINGSDFIKQNISFRFENFFKYKFIISYSKFVSGENNIVLDPYLGNINIFEVDFPSGLNYNIYNFNVLYKYWYNKNICFEMFYNRSTGQIIKDELNFSVLYTLPLSEFYN
jgi:hypothetical protein